MKISVDEFADKLGEIQPMIMREFIRRQSGEFKGNITIAQFAMIEYLSKRGEAKMTELASFLGVTTAAMTGMVDRLVKSGFVKRANMPHDRRVVKVVPTNKGSELVGRIVRERRDMTKDIFGRLPQEDRENYLRILLRIKDILVSMKKMPEKIKNA